jgi:UDP-N-acetylmuramyl pentapeptide synthase
MGSERPPQIMRAQKSEEILIIEIHKDYFSNIKALFSTI